MSKIFTTKQTSKVFNQLRVENLWNEKETKYARGLSDLKLSEELINKIWLHIPLAEKLKIAIIQETIERLRRRSICDDY